MNLEMLGDNLDEMGGWPDLQAQPYEGPSALAGGHQFGLCSAGVRRCHARSLSAGPARQDQRRGPLGAQRAA